MFSLDGYVTFRNAAMCYEMVELFHHIGNCIRFSVSDEALRLHPKPKYGIRSLVISIYASSGLRLRNGSQQLSVLNTSRPSSAATAQSKSPCITMGFCIVRGYISYLPGLLRSGV